MIAVTAAVPGSTTAADGEPLTYAVHGGSARTPILTVHGLVSSAQHWRFFTPHYAATRSVVTWDYRGHGGLPAPRAPAEITVGQFADGRGVLLPATGDQPGFHALRRAALSDVVERPRLLEPHVTLMHPRNSTCTDAAFAAIVARALPQRLTFATVSLIEQADGGPWRVLEVFALTDAAERDPAPT